MPKLKLQRIIIQKKFSNFIGVHITKTKRIKGSYYTLDKQDGIRLHVCTPTIIVRIDIDNERMNVTMSVSSISTTPSPLPTLPTPNPLFG